MELPSLNRNRVLAIFGFVLVFFILGFLLFWAFFRSDTTVDNNSNSSSNGRLPTTNNGTNRAPTNTNGSTALPLTNIQLEVPTATASGGKTVANSLVDTPSDHISLAGNGVDLIYYESISGQFYQLDRNGVERRVLNDTPFKGVSEVAWSANRQRAVLSFPDGANIVYDFTRQQQVSLPSELQEFSFSPDSSQLAAKFIGPTQGDNWLAVVDVNGGNVQVIEPLGEKENLVQVNWSPNAQVVATYQQSIDSERQRIVPLGIQGENFKSFEVEGRGFQGKWDQSGNRLLYSVYSTSTSMNPDLYIVQARGDETGESNTRLNLQTWPDKCAFTSNATTVYCAVPQTLSVGSGLYPELAKDVPYQFYEVNLATGAKQLLATPTNTTGDVNYSVGNVYLSGTGDQLYFTDQDGKIRTIKLR